MKVTCTRRIQWCMGHRVSGHEGHCAMLHGHNYVALVTAEAEQLDGVGRVVDFSVLKEKVGGWIEDCWDHGFVVWVGDKPAIDLLRTARSLPNGQKAYYLPANPTAENLAAHLLTFVGPAVLDGTGVRIVKVELWETENCRAEVSL